MVDDNNDNDDSEINVNKVEEIDLEMLFDQ